MIIKPKISISTKKNEQVINTIPEKVPQILTIKNGHTIDYMNSNIMLCCLTQSI